MTLEDFVCTLNTAQMDIVIHLFHSHEQYELKVATLVDSDDNDKWLDLHFSEYKNSEIIDICPWLKKDKVYSDTAMCDIDDVDVSSIHFTVMI